MPGYKWSNGEEVSAYFLYIGDNLAVHVDTGELLIVSSLTKVDGYISKEIVDSRPADMSDDYPAWDAWAKACLDSIK